MVTYSEVKHAKDLALLALNIVTSKYSADIYSIDCERMSQEDFKIYQQLDDCIESLKATMQKLTPSPDSGGEGVTGEYGE